MNQDNHEYRILGFNVFNIENETYLALNDQQADTWSGGVSTLSVYDITDPSKMELGPDDAGYDKFCLFRGEWSPYATSYTHNGMFIKVSNFDVGIRHRLPSVFPTSLHKQLVIYVLRHGGCHALQSKISLTCQSDFMYFFL